MATDDKRNLPVDPDRRRQQVDLHDNGLRAGNLIDKSISRLDPKQVQALGVKAAEEALRLEAHRTKQNIDYVTGKKVVEDHIDAFDALNKNGKLTRQSVTTDVETGAGRMRIESKSGATCFVATVAYGDWQHPDVAFLRWYRDHILVNSPSGRAFTRVYWRIGPHLATFVGAVPQLRGAARRSIGKIVVLLRRRHER